MRNQLVHRQETNLNSDSNDNNCQFRDISEGMSSISKKKQCFHKQIRKQQLSQYFKAKRIILMQNLNSNVNNSPQWQLSKKKTLLQCYQCILKRQNLNQSIRTLVNLLALPKPFELLVQNDRQPRPDQIIGFSIDLVNLILNQTIPEFSTNQQQRIFCFNALSNLFADQLCQNARFVKIVAQFLQRHYGGVQIWGIDAQMIQIYYMIGNLMRKQIVQADFLFIQKLLQWCQSAIAELPSDPLKSLSSGMNQFFSDVDQIYNSKGSRSYFTDHFRPSRQIIVQNLLKRLIETAHGSKLQTKGNLSLDSQNILSIYRFFNLNKQYLLKCFVEWQSDYQDKKYLGYFVYKTLHLINNQLLSKKVVSQIGNSLLSFLKYYSHQSQTEMVSSQEKQAQMHSLNQSVSNIHKLLLKNCIQQILRNICCQNFDVKIIYLKVVNELLMNCAHSLQLTSQKQLCQAFYFVLVDKKLQNVLTDLLTDTNSKFYDIQMLKQIINIYHLVIAAGQGNLGLKIKDKLTRLIQQQSNLQLSIYQLISEFISLHEDKIKENQVLRLEDV